LNRDSLTVVNNTDHPAGWGCCAFHHNLKGGVLGAKAHGVVEEVSEHLSDLVLFSTDRDGVMT
jgi:hypothetical protein